MASPSVRPGNGTPCNVTECNCWNVGNPFGCTLVERLATERNQRAGTGAHLIAGQPIRREPEVPRRLRDDFVATSMQTETVDIISAEQCGERGADILHADAEPVCRHRS